MNFWNLQFSFRSIVPPLRSLNSSNDRNMSAMVTSRAYGSCWSQIVFGTQAIDWAHLRTAAIQNVLFPSSLTRSVMIFLIFFLK
ncbi:MAG TPA: hypothetical protein VNJ01_11060 [Bacteriovoracaceae bacterium]|nr:hypothetical protein [Bacteriovoracaceae bacterium]